MKSESQSNQLQFLPPSLREMSNRKNPLWQLAENIDWFEIEDHHPFLLWPKNTSYRGTKE